MQTKYRFTVPNDKKIRLIIDTDAKNEADDQFAIVHALLTPKFIIKGLIAAHFGTRRNNFSMVESYAEIRKILQIMHIGDEIPVAHGYEKALSDEHHILSSEGSDLIIQEALSNDPHPLFCIFLGPLTDMAIALLKCPEIETRLTVLWIGGGRWPIGGDEFNLSNDILAANIVFQSNAPLWQVPRNIYSRMRVSLAELQKKVQPYGEIGKYLFQQMVDFNIALGKNPVWPLGESWVLGDSAAIGLLMDDQDFCYDTVPAPSVSDDMTYLHDKQHRAIRVYNTIDSRFILEDFFSKMEINFSSS